MIEQHHHKDATQQKNIFIEELHAYQKDYEKNDDITFVYIKVEPS